MSESEMRDAARQQGNAFAQAMVSGNYDTVVGGMTPQVIDSGGGKDAALKSLQDWGQEMKSQNITIHSIDIGDVSQIKHTDSGQFAVVPETVITQIPGGWLTSDSYLLGISPDGGHTWNFIDSVAVEKLGGKLRAVLTDLPADLTLPKVTPAMFSTEMPQSPTAPVLIERADFRVTVPPGSTIDPPDPDIDKDHYVSVNVPNGVTLIFLVVDDKTSADSVLQRTLNYYHDKLQDITTAPSHSFDSRGGKGTVTEGKINGVRSVFEAGYITGKQKAFLINYASEKSVLDDGRKVYHQTIDSFVIKE